MVFPSPDCSSIVNSYAVPMEREFYQVELEFAIQLPDEAGLTRGLCQFPSPLGDAHGVVKPPGLGIGCGERAEKERILSPGSLIRLFGQFHGPATIAQRCQRSSRQHPRQGVLNFRLAGIDLQRLLKFNDGFTFPSHLEQRPAENVVGAGVVGTDLEHSLEMDYCFVFLPDLEQSEAEIILAFPVMGIDL